MTRTALLLFACFLVAEAHAAQRVHKAATGETLEQIAEHYYGDSGFAGALREHNALGNEPLEAGRVVLLPIADSHTVVAGDTWEKLAEKYWQAATLGKVLSRLVLPPDAKLEPGTVLSIPARAHHRIEAGENLALLSRRAYDGPDRALDIAALNGLKNPNRIAIKQRLLVPLFGLPAALQKDVKTAPVAEVEAPPTPQASEPVPPPESVAAAKLPTPEAAQEAIPEAITAAPGNRGPAFTPVLTSAVDAYYRGDFGFARDVLERARPSVLAHGARQEQELLLHHLVLIYAAYDEPAAVCESYAGLKTLAPATEYDPRLISPKVRELTSRCR